MSATGKRGADALNIIGIVTVGVCGAVLTYVSVILLEAFYMNDTSQVERQTAFEAPQSLRNTVSALGRGNLDGTKEGSIAIDEAMKLVVADAAKDPSNLVPSVGASTKPTVKAMYGRPEAITPAADTAPGTGGVAPAGTATTPPPAAPAGGQQPDVASPGAGTGAGSAPANPTPVAPTPTEPTTTPGAGQPQGQPAQGGDAP